VLIAIFYRRFGMTCYLHHHGNLKRFFFQFPGVMCRHCPDMSVMQFESTPNHTSEN